MERAFHQRLDLAGAGHGDGLRRRGLAVLRRNDLVRRQIELRQRGGGADLGLRPNQHRHDEIDAGGFHGAEQRRRVDRVDNRGTDRIETAGHLDQEFIASPLLPQLDFGENDAGSRDLLGRRDDLCGAGDDLLRSLIDGPAIEDDPVRFFDLVSHLHRDGDRVTEANRIPGSAATGRHRSVPGPGSCVPSTVEISAPLHMPCATTLWNMSLLAKASSRCVGLMSPDMIANSSMSLWVSVRTRLAVSPSLISSNVLFSMRSIPPLRIRSLADDVSAATC